MFTNCLSDKLIIKRPGVARASLLTALSLINQLI